MNKNVLVIIALVILSITMFRLGYMICEKKYSEQLNEAFKQASINQTIIEAMLLKEKATLEKIKETNLDCEKVLNFNLRNCFK